MGAVRGKIDKIGRDKDDKKERYIDIYNTQTLYTYHSLFMNLFFQEKKVQLIFC